MKNTNETIALDILIEELRADEMTAEEVLNAILRRPEMFGLVSKDRYDRLKAERDAAVAAIERVRRAVAGHPKCDRYEEDDAISCGWKSAYASVVWALDGAPEPEGVWEYRGRLQSCGYVAEGYISAEHAMNGLKAELEDHPYLQMDDTAIVERARVRKWLPVEGESK